MKSIKWRLTLFYVLLVTIVMIASGFIIVNDVRTKAEQNLYNELQGNVSLIKEIKDVTSEEEMLKAIVQGINTGKKYYIDKNIYLFNKEGQLVYPADKMKDESILYKREVKKALNGEKTVTLDRSYELDDEGHQIQIRGYAEPIKSEGEVLYVIYIRANTKDDQKNLYETIGTIIRSTVIAVIFASILGFVFASKLTEPIIVLTDRARHLASGGFTKDDYGIKVKSDDEIGELTGSFNNMAKELNKTLSEISNEKNKLETVFTHMADGILVFNYNGKLITANPTAYQMLGVNISGRDYAKIFTEFENYIEFDSLLKLEKNAIKQNTVFVKTKFINICFATYAKKSSDPVGLIAVLQDITEHKKLEEMQKEFVANVSHELRTPITTIKSYTETLIDGALEDREIAGEFLEVINNESDRMTTLVKDLLELSKLDNRQTKFEINILNLTQLVKGCVDKYKIHSDKKHQKMSYHDDGNQYIIKGDSNRIEQVVRNVISNAIKYSPEKSSINIDVLADNNNIIVKIRDNGMGIPKEDISRIFDRFYRVDKARSRAMGGTGLGLAIAKEIMIFHEGEIKVESEYRKGTVFTLLFKKSTEDIVDLES